MNETKYTLLCNTGHTLTGLTSEQLATMYKEDRLPYGRICDEQSPNDVYPVENVVEVFCKDTGTYKNIATLDDEFQTKCKLQRDQNNFKEMVQFFAVMIGGCIALALASIPFIEFVDRHF